MALRKNRSILKELPQVNTFINAIQRHLLLFQLEYPTPIWQTRGKIVMVMLALPEIKSSWQHACPQISHVYAFTVVPWPNKFCLTAMASKFPQHYYEENIHCSFSSNILLHIWFDFPIQFTNSSWFTSLNLRHCWMSGELFKLYVEWAKFILYAKVKHIEYS